MAKLDRDLLYSVLPEHNRPHATMNDILMDYQQANGSWKVTYEAVRGALSEMEREGHVESTMVRRQNLCMPESPVGYSGMGSPPSREDMASNFIAFRKSKPEGVAQIPSSSDARQSQTERDIADVVASAPREFEPDDDPPF